MQGETDIMKLYISMNTYCRSKVPTSFFLCGDEVNSGEREVAAAAFHQGIADPHVQPFVVS